MKSLLICLALVVCICDAILSQEEAFEIAMMKKQEFQREEGESLFDECMSRVVTMLDYEDLNNEEAAETWNDVLTRDITYRRVGNGECKGLAQVYL